jgi:hypothetical protein
MPPVGFKPTVLAGKRPKTYVLDRAANGTGTQMILENKKIFFIEESVKISVTEDGSIDKSS